VWISAKRAWSCRLIGGGISISIPVRSRRAISPASGAADGSWFPEAIGGGSHTHLLAKTSTRQGGNMIEYRDEDPTIREMYAELTEN
jgi:hypothetical protein